LRQETSFCGNSWRCIKSARSNPNVPEQVAKLCQGLPPDKQEAVLDFVEILVSPQVPTSWTVEKRQEAVARTMGCLRQTRTSSEAFAQRKQDEKTHEERRWKA
jgi:hypothetical protein